MRSLHVFGYVLLVIFFSFCHYRTIAAFYNSENTFSIANTTSSQQLCQEYDSTCCIGTTWNITIYIHANSTSTINFEFYPQDPNRIPEIWEGKKSFEVAPNETYSGEYIQHVVSDNVGHWWIDYSLSDPTKKASGTYTLEKTNPGYSVFVGTGNIYVGNITAWLESQGQTTHLTDNVTTTTSSITPFLEIMTISLSILVIGYSRRKK
ncbi:MAG: hypothetical protein ACW97Z_12095 [Candidatus Hodarchaeales archaeon]|jgi:hypothetical protein